MDALPSPGRTNAPVQPVPGEEIRRVERGKAIYLRATSPSGQPIKARLAGSSTDVPAAVLTCGNCHGRDGVGKAEGGITPATITWDELTKVYGPSHPSGRQRPAYDANSVRRAITMGLDPAGRALDSSMPRYALTRDDLDDLVAYLRELGRDCDPGITDQAIVVGTVLAPPKSLGELSRAVKSVLTAYFAEVNHRGGIFGRRVEIRSLEAPESAREWASAAHRFFQGQEVFALIAPFIAGSEGQASTLARQESVPVVGPFTLYPEVGYPLNRQVFYLHSGLGDQVRALAMFAGSRLAGQKPAAIVLFGDTDRLSRVTAELVQAECARLGWQEVELVPISRGPRSMGIVERLQGKKAEVVFVLAPEGREVSDLFNSSSRDWQPLLLLPGALAGQKVLETASGARDRLFLSFPTLPFDQTREGAAELERLAAAHGLPGEQRSSQIDALVAAKIFVEAMTAAGRRASREKLIEQLEQFYEKPTGLTRPITFSANRRVGTRGAYIVGIDPKRAKLVPVSGFIEPPAH